MKLSNRPHLLNCESDRNEVIANLEGALLTHAEIVSFMKEPHPGFEVLLAFIECLKEDDRAKKKKERMFFKPMNLVSFPLEINLMFFF